MLIYLMGKIPPWLSEEKTSTQESQWSQISKQSSMSLDTLTIKFLDWIATLKLF